MNKYAAVIAKCFELNDNAKEKIKTVIANELNLSNLTEFNNETINPLVFEQLPQDIKQETSSC